MTSWQSLTKNGIGSFRSVPFRALSIELQGGRRTSVYEFHAQDNGRTEDIGRRMRKFSVSFVVLGDTYHASRNDMITALETSGAGVLEYPVLGRVSVVVDGAYRITEDSAALGGAVFSVTFAESGEALTPIEEESTAQAVIEAGDDSALANAASFARQFIARTSVAVKNAIKTVNEAASAVRKINKKIQSAMRVISEASEAIDNITSTVTTLIATPATLMSEIQGAISTAFRAIDDIDTALTSSIAALSGAGPASLDRTVARYKSSVLRNAIFYSILYGDTSRQSEHQAFFGVQAQTITGNGTNATRSRANLAAMRTATKVVCAVEASRFLVDLPFTSSDEIKALRDDIVSLIDDAMLTADDELYASLAKLKSATNTHVHVQLKKLPNNETVFPKAVTSSLAFAYEQYGDTSREPDISLGNSLPNPAAILAGTPIRIAR